MRQPIAQGASPPTFAPASRIGLRTTRRARVRREPLPWLALALVASLFWPTAYAFAVGSVQFTPYRVVLLLGLVGAAYRLAQGRFRLRAPDYLIGLFSLGIATSLIANHGLFTTFFVDSSRGGYQSVAYEAVAAAILETFGAYLIARAFVVGPAQFDSVMKAFGWGILIMCAFTVVESQTGRNAFGVYAGSGIGEVRFGLHRAAGTFPHSILWGLFAATPFVYFAARVLLKRRPSAALFAVACVVGVVTSVSSTAAMALVLQTASLAWATLMKTKRRWTLLVLGGVLAIVSLEVFSDRPLVNVLIGSLSFSPDTGYIRLIQWQYGWAEAIAHPLLGIGMHEWSRPFWLAASIDSYWLATAVRHGLIVPLLLLVVLALLLHRAARASRVVEPDARFLIRIWAITVVVLAVAGVTVHFWAQSLVLWFFLLGCLGALTETSGPARIRR